MDSVKLTYQTAVATLIQFIVLSLLSLANSLNSIVTTCVKDSGHCIENMIPSIILFILTAMWFAFIWILGYTAQERRSRRLAQALIAAELLIAAVAFFSVKHHSDLLSMVTSLIDFVLAIWIITLAFRLMRAGGGRVVTRQRSRSRRRPPSPTA